MQTLLIDNYDSFTFNLYQLIARVSGSNPIVVRNDQLSWQQLQKHSFDNIVISPGPGSAGNPRDFGVCADVVLKATCPVLGVCLGHQGIAHYYGGSVVRAPEPFHGRLSKIYHDGTNLFLGLPNPFSAVRYHSLIVDRIPADLEITAWNEEHLVMGLRHKTKPIFGVQFHPESVCTEDGSALMRNFLAIGHSARADARLTPNPVESHSNGNGKAKRPTPQTAYVAVTRKFPATCPAEDAFVSLFGESSQAFWLDSAAFNTQQGRFSFMGNSDGPYSRVLSYSAAKQRLSITTAESSVTTSEHIFDYLNRTLEEEAITLEGAMPFGFNGGYVGYFGYETCATSEKNEAPASHIPDAMLIRADRLVVFDHFTNEIWLVCVTPVASEAIAEDWLDSTMSRLIKLTKAARPPVASPRDSIHVSLRYSPETYLSMIDQCAEYLRAGESYELCLTNQLLVEAKVDPLNFYLQLRKANPAPFGAYLRLRDIAVACSSPECFLQIDTSGVVSTKPIKGTARRSCLPELDAVVRENLRRDEKTRAENLMIADLLRNDLGQVCKVGSVTVPSLMDVETYETVHQMVSTISGTLLPGHSAVDCLKSAFPGGSMTGAPKKRSMELLAGLEGQPRGIYSGCIGFLGFSGAASLNIVIRTAILEQDRINVGTGGAIVAQSDRQQELQETFVKLEPVIRALAKATSTPEFHPTLSGDDSVIAIWKKALQAYPNSLEGHDLITGLVGRSSLVLG